jgi:NifB/MoaA-like Fe-S oxidoreductase
LTDTQRAELTELRLQVIAADGQACEHYDARIAAEAEREALREALTDPVAVHANMLRGTIAKPTIEQILHVYPDLRELIEALTPNTGTPS